MKTSDARSGQASGWTEMVGKPEKKGAEKDGMRGFFL
jgi:hypothetical protein